jgi:hypothetical protein
MEPSRGATYVVAVNRLAAGTMVGEVLHLSLRDFQIFHGNDLVQRVCST